MWIMQPDDDSYAFELGGVPPHPDEGGAAVWTVVDRGRNTVVTIYLIVILSLHLGATVAADHGTI